MPQGKPFHANGMQPAVRPIVRSVLLLLSFLAAAWLSTRSFFDSPSPVVYGPVLLADAQGELTPLEVLRRAAEHRADGEDPAVGMATRGYWWLARVENPTDGEHWMVHVGNTAIERVQLYLFDGDQQVHGDAVDLLAVARAGVPNNVVGHHFPVTLPAGGTRTVLLRLETDVAHNGLVFIKPAATAEAEAHFHMIAIWSAAGAIAALICYNLFLGVSLRLNTYLFYVGHATGHLVYLLTALGLLGASLPIMERYLLLNIPGIALGVLSGALFIYHFLDLPSLSRRLARIYRLFIGAMCAAPLLVLFLEPHPFLTLIRSSHLVLALLVIAAALIGVARHRREALFILVGWGGLVAMTAKGMLGVLGMVALSADTGIWALWAMLFEMFFLSLALADRVRRLHREKEAAEAVAAAKSAFLANMSHEIRTPLNGVLGMVDVLRKTPLDARQQEYLEHVRQSGSALLTLLNDILDFSRAEAGRIRLEAADFSPRALLEELMLLLTPQAAAKGLRLHLHVDADVPPVLKGDAGRLRQVLLNIIGNAVKFTEQGEVRVGLSCRADDTRRRNRLVFSIRDTGIGMSPEALREVFSRFHQADSSIARRYGGAGLGLAIAKELVALMGGRIHIDSTPGRGSHFQVEVSLPTGAAPDTRAEAAPVALPQLDILVVDDDRINRLVAGELLSRDGHRVVQVDSGAAALERLARESFDLVLMDVSMPEMDGMDTTRRLRATGNRVLIIGLTAHVLPEQQHACMAAGMDAVIHKPIQADRLNRLLADVLRQAGFDVDTAEMVAPH